MNNILKEIQKYYIYDKESKDFDKWYTTDESLIRNFKIAKRYYKISEICGCISLTSFFGVLISGGLRSWIAALSFGVLMISSLLIGFLIFLEKYDILFTKTLNKYYETQEYKSLYDKYIKEEQERQDKILTEKATNLVESYDILDNKHLSKEERIEYLKKYIK